jgi:hypothetical protein
MSLFFKESTEQLAEFFENITPQIKEAQKNNADQIKVPLTKAQLAPAMMLKTEMESKNPGKFAFIFSENYDALTIRILDPKKVKNEF